MSSLKIETKGTIQNLMSKLISLKVFDLEIERKRQIWGWVWGLCLSVAILTLIGAGILVDKTGDSALFVIPGVFGAAFVPALIIYIIQVMKDLENRKLDAAMGLVKTISEDIPPGAQCELMLDFRTYRKGGTLVSKEGGWIGVKHYTYNHPWLLFAGKLYDGNKFEMGVEQDVKRTQVPKRKYTKIKERISEKATLTVRLNPDVYPNPGQVADNVTIGATPFGCQVKRALGKEKALKVSMSSGVAKFVTGRAGRMGTEENLLDSSRLIGLFVETYSGISKARPAA